MNLSSMFKANYIYYKTKGLKTRHNLTQRGLSPSLIASTLSCGREKKEYKSYEAERWDKNDKVNYEG